MRYCMFMVMLLASIAEANPGYYRQPSINGETLVFVAEGDLWKVPTSGGAATRLTTHPAEEMQPSISPDGNTIAFLAQYEGPTEVYTMPVAGGRPERRTWDGARVTHLGWTPNGQLLISTDIDATLPAQNLVTVDLKSRERKRIPLAQAADGAIAADGTIFFTRLPFQGSQCKNYAGGTAQQLWKFKPGDAEATHLTADHKGTNKSPVILGKRVYFLSDRDGTMNVWSFALAGGDLKQHTKHVGYDIITMAGAGATLVYHQKADLRRLNVDLGTDEAINISLTSDFDHLREKQIPRPMEWLSHAHLSPNGDRVVLTARGRVFVAPTGKGRLIEVTRQAGVRYRDARFLADGITLSVLSDQSDEVELWKLPANGVGNSEQLTKDGDVLRWEQIPSPNGKLIAHHDKNQRLWIYDLEKKTNTKIDDNPYGDFDDIVWSPNSEWLAYSYEGENMLRRVKVHRVATGTTAFVTTNRFDSFSPAWDAAGKFLYFLSNRNLNTSASGPWGAYQPEPNFDNKTKIYQVALNTGVRSPFVPKDEGSPAEVVKKDVDLVGIEKRILELPIAAGNYGDLKANDKGLFWRSFPTNGVNALLTCAYFEKPAVHTIADAIIYYTMSKDGNKLLIRKGDNLHAVDATTTAQLGGAIDLSAWMLTVKPQEEWKQMFVDAWRMERDYFYDPNMHGADWKKVRAKYQPLAERVASRGDLNDLIAQMVSELSALHTSVRGGDFRKGPDDVTNAFLGARMERDEKAGGYRVAHIYAHDPDEPSRAGPLSRPGVNVAVGDVIEAINGVRTLDVPDLGELLRKKIGVPILCKVKTGDQSREVTVRPINAEALADLKYHEWEYTRRTRVEQASGDKIAYLHLRAMGAKDYNDFAKGFYPNYTKAGLIIDVRNNRGGNIDSWILDRLSRKVWFYWSRRVGRASSWNMQSAFRGHLVVLCNEFTASDGEAFCEGVKRLKLGTVIGTRTWGGEVWLRANNFLVDRGIASAAEFGVFSPDGQWLIEGHGVDPDVVIDNLPHETFQGKDAQLEKAISVLTEKIKNDPRPLPPIPKYPTPAKTK